MLDPIVRAYSEQRYFLVRLRLILLGVLTAGLWVGVKNFGPLGAIVVVVSITLLEHLIITYRSAKIIGFRKTDASLLTDVWKLGIATVIASLAGVMSKAFLVGFRPFYILLITGIIFSAFYIIVVLLMKIPNSDEKHLVREKFFELERLLLGKRTAQPLVGASAVPTVDRSSTRPPEF
jgi:hypothetical protein